jgi:hypothetical protein
MANGPSYIVTGTRSGQLHVSGPLSAVEASYRYRGMRTIGFEALSIIDAETGDEQDPIIFAALTENGHLI